jgi:hypothetical protein
VALFFITHAKSSCSKKVLHSNFYFYLAPGKSSIAQAPSAQQKNFNVILGKPCRAKLSIKNLKSIFLFDAQ